MMEEVRKAERRRQVEEIKRLYPVREGGGAYLPGLWACRLASGYSQRELADRAGTSFIFCGFNSRLIVFSGPREDQFILEILFEGFFTSSFRL